MIGRQVVSIVHVDRRSDEGLDEIEDCWRLRDVGYNSVWVSEVRWVTILAVSSWKLLQARQHFIG